MFVIQLLVYILLMILIIGLYSCVKKISDDIESIRTQHRHSFYIYDE